MRDLIKEGEKQKDFAKRVGVHYNTITNYLTVDRSPDDGVIFKICRATGVNFDWLKEGRGPKYSEGGWVSALEPRVMNPQTIEAMGLKEIDEDREYRSLGDKRTRPAGREDALALIASDLSRLGLGREREELLEGLLRRAASDPRVLEDLLALAALVELREKMRKT